MSEGKQSEVGMATIAEAAVPTRHLEALYQAYCTRVFRTAYRVTGNYGDAEDVLQTVFLRLMERRLDYPIADPAGYLHRTAVNVALDVLRTRRRAEAVPLDESDPGLVRETRAGPERMHAAAELREALRRAMAGLSPKAAEIFVLRYIEGCGYREIARLVGASLSNVAVTLHRARRRLQHDLASLQGGCHEP